MKAFWIMFVLYCSTFVTGHEEPSNPSGIELAEDILKSMTTAEELLDLICSCRESGKTDESKLSSVDVTPRPVDCLDVKELGYTTSGRYNIYPSSRGISDAPVEVWCDMDDAEGGWMVIQRREDGSVNFNGTWDDYQRGFGYAGGEFWIGNDNLHHITNQKSYELRAEVELWNGSQIVRDFDHFRLGDETLKYQLVANSGTPQDICTSPGPLGMEDGRIQDSSISASSVYSSSYVAVNARANHDSYSGAWAAGSKNLNQWIQVAFGSPHRMTGVITQGGSGEWVTKFKVQYSNDGTSWTYIKDGNAQDAVFAGNSDRDTPVTNLYKAPVTANFIRIRPTEWHSHITFRFEVIGCNYAQLSAYNTWTNLNYQPFSTKDTDNDGVDGSNCAAVGGAWWYGDVCVQGGLNGEYMKGTETDNKGIIWEDMGSTYRVKRSEMKIRPVGA